MNEAERIALYAPEGDVIGLAAYALHRRALAAFRAEFESRHARAPDGVEEGAFLLGEETPARIDAYRQQALAMSAPVSQDKRAARNRRRWPFFGQWVEPPASFEPDQPVNWRGLFARFAVLLAAVIATAVLLRTLFVPA